MRLSTPLSLCLAAAAALLPTTATTTATAAVSAAIPVDVPVDVPVAVPASIPADIPAFVALRAASGSVPDCADGRPSFPLTTRIHGGPATYRAGGESGTWYLDLTNTTDRPCTAVHPVVILTDTGRGLRPGLPHMVFHDGPRAHPVRFEATDEAELVAAFDDGFPGFTVAPGRTVTVKVTLAFSADAVPDQVTLRAAVVRRRGDDGDWIGQSGDYRFGVDTEPATSVPESADPPAPVPTAASAASSVSSSPSASASASALAFAEAAQQLARTGLGSAQRAALALAAALVAMGSALLLLRRRR